MLQECLDSKISRLVKIVKVPIKKTKNKNHTLYTVMRKEKKTMEETNDSTMAQ